jgi:hypothetical protein
MNIKIDRINKKQNLIHIAKDVSHGVLSGIALSFQEFEKLTGKKAGDVLSGKAPSAFDVDISRYESILRGDELEPIKAQPATKPATARKMSDNRPEITLGDQE